MQRQNIETINHTANLLNFFVIVTDPWSYTPLYSARGKTLRIKETTNYLIFQIEIEGTVETHSLVKNKH